MVRRLTSGSQPRGTNQNFDTALNAAKQARDKTAISPTRSSDRPKKNTPFDEALNKANASREKIYEKLDKYNQQLATNNRDRLGL